MGPGQPLKFKTVKILSDKIGEYFAKCAPHIAMRPTVVGMVKEMRGRGKNKKEVIRHPKRGEYPNHWVEGTEPYVTPEEPPTITGLAYHLETSRETLLNYSKKEEYFDTIEKAKAYIHSYAEKSLWQGKISSGIIFNLKNNWGWQDKHEFENKQVFTGFEHLTNDQLKQKIEELKRSTGIK